MIVHPPLLSADASEIDLVGHSSLNSRGMNAGLAIAGNYAYVGNRTDFKPGGLNAGVLIVAIDDPARPRVIGQIEPEPNETGLSSRELRAWPGRELLIVMNLTCEATLHRCARPTAPPRIDFFDIHSPEAPRRLSSYRPRIEPHEMFLWVDPSTDGRALLYLSTNVASRSLPDLLVIDISRARDGVFDEIASWNAEQLENDPATAGYPSRLHSISVLPDGRRGYAALWGGGFQILETSEVSEAKSKPTIRVATSTRLAWRGPAHSAVKVPGRSLAVVSDEVQGACPWGWVRIADVSNERRPTISSEFRTEQNRRSSCAELRAKGLASHSHTAHNPTVLSNLAFVTWHSAGLQAIDLENPRRLQSAGSFTPEPLERVATEDPDLTGGRIGVAMWSYPIIKDGLIYVVDVRNGFYVLKYQGERAAEVGAVKFAEGNSNVGFEFPSPASPPPSPAAEPAGPTGAETQAPTQPAIDLWPWWALVFGSLVVAVAIIGWIWRRRAR